MPGEDGLFGDEEDHTHQACHSSAQKRACGLRSISPRSPSIARPLPAHFDAVIAMYHDQGLIPFKLLHFEDGVNVTLGLPIVRTSVDHGTAYDIAGKGLADHRSLTEAIQLAAAISVHRASFHKDLQKRIEV